MTGIALLRPKTRALCNLFAKTCMDAGINVIITQTMRTFDEQQAIYMQGRSTLDKINDFRKEHGLYLIGEEDNIIVSHAMPGQSPHNYGLAFDFAILHNGQATWNDSSPEWLQAVEIAESLNVDGYTLEAGYRWTKFKDSPHFQVKFGEKKWRNFI